MKRWLLASAIFIGGMLVILAVPAYRSYRAISTEKATGIALVISRDTVVSRKLCTFQKGFTPVSV